MISLEPKEADLINSVSSQYDEYIATLKSWSRVNSGSRNQSGLEQMRHLLSVYMAGLPGDITYPGLNASQTISPKGIKEITQYSPAVLLTVRPAAPVQLVLTGHYDTVFPADSDFQAPIDIDNDTINGPGVADMKGGILVMLNALKVFEMSENSDAVGYSVLLSPDEEIGSPGSAPLLAKLGAAADVGLTYEPALADGSMAGARKGSGNFALIIRGQAAHAGREHHLGRNAIAAMAEFIIGLESLNRKKDGVTFNIAKIDGGGAVNIVPDLAIGRFNVRVKALPDMEWVTSQLESLIDVQNKKNGISAELTGGFTRPPKPMAPANLQIFNWVKQAGSLLGQSISWSPSGGVCEGNNLWAAGCPNVDTLGVRGGRIHSDQEFIKLSSLVERTQLSALILMKIASGTFDAKAVKRQAVEHMAEEAQSC